MSGQLADQWPVKTLNELINEGLITLGRGKVISRKDLAATPGTYPVYSSAKQNDGKFGEYGLYMFDEELITWSVDGGGRLFHRPKHKFSVTNVGGTLRINDTSRLNYKFLYYCLTLLHSKINFDWVKKAHPSIIRKLYNEIPIPSLVQQKQIVSILDDAFEKIAITKKQVIEKHQDSHDFFQSLLREIMLGNNEGWQSESLLELSESLHQGLNTAGHKIQFYETGYPIIQTRNLNNGVIDLEEKIKFLGEEDWNKYRDKYKPKVGDVFFSNIGTIGKTAVVPAEKDYLIHWNIFKIRPKKMIDPHFLKYFLDMLTNDGFFVNKQKGGTVNFVTKKMMSEVIVNFPSLVQQCEIVERIIQLKEYSQKLGQTFLQESASLDELKQSILQEAFNGTLRITEGLAGQS